MTVVGLLHPGAMGVTLGATLRAGGHEVLWASEGRGPATRARAEDAGLSEVGSLGDLIAHADVVLSVCPPHAAETVARQVVAEGFRGLYIDANAVSKQRAQIIGAVVDFAGGSFVDGGIIGPPAQRSGTTWLHLSGPRAAEAASLFAAGPLETSVLSAEAGDASALKMCFAAYSKGLTALLATSLEAADRLGVRAALDAQRDATEPGSAARLAAMAEGSGAKAWRFVGEMREIADTFASVGLPNGFHLAAAEVYQQMAAAAGGEPGEGAPGEGTAGEAETGS